MFWSAQAVSRMIVPVFCVSSGAVPESSPPLPPDSGSFGKNSVYFFYRFPWNGDCLPVPAVFRIHFQPCWLIKIKQTELTVSFAFIHVRSCKCKVLFDFGYFSCISIITWMIHKCSKFKEFLTFFIALGRH